MAFGDSRAKNSWIVVFEIKDQVCQYVTGDFTYDYPRYTEVRGNAYRFKTKRDASFYARLKNHRVEKFLQEVR